MAVIQATDGQLFIQDEFVGEVEYTLISSPPSDKEREERRIALVATGREFSGAFMWDDEHKDNWRLFPHKQQPCNLTIIYELWFSPTVLLLNAFVDSIEADSDPDGSDIATVQFSGGGSLITFARWWHRPIWWMYGRWMKLRELWTQ